MCVCVCESMCMCVWLGGRLLKLQRRDVDGQPVENEKGGQSEQAQGVLPESHTFPLSQ